MVYLFIDLSENIQDQDCGLPSKLPKGHGRLVDLVYGLCSHSLCQFLLNFESTEQT